jgi:hypothetical protein
MVLQYSTMMAERRASLLVDNISSLVEGLAGAVVKVSKLPPAAVWYACISSAPGIQFSRAMQASADRKQQQMCLVAGVRSQRSALP